MKATGVNGDGDDDMVRGSLVLEEDKVGNDGADTSADFDPRRQSDVVLNAGRVLAEIRTSWFLHAGPSSVHGCSFSCCCQR